MSEDLDFIQSRVAYWDEQLSNLLTRTDAKNVVSVCVSMLSNRDSCDRYATAREQALQAKIDALMLESWVSVQDQMPPEGEEVLVWVAKTTYWSTSHAALDTWAEQREDPIGMGGPTIVTGVMWNDHDFEAISHWKRIGAPGEKMVNDLTEAETSATASCAGLLGKDDQGCDRN